MGRPELGLFGEADSTWMPRSLTSIVSSSLRLISSAGEPGSEFDCAYSACGVEGVVHEAVSVGEPRPPFVDRRRRFSASSRTMSVSSSAGSSRLERLTVKSVNCSASLSQPKIRLKSRSMISSCWMFLKANRGTAVSNGNSSYPLISRALGSDVNLNDGSLVKAE